MADETNDWNAPEVTPLTDADGASTHPTARIRNGGEPQPTPTSNPA